MSIYMIIYTHMILSRLFYGDDYVAMRSLWMDLCRGRIWLNWYYELPPSWVVWLAFQPRWILGRSGDATVSSRGLPRPTPVTGLSMIYLMISLYYIYKYEFMCIRILI